METIVQLGTDYQPPRDLLARFRSPREVKRLRPRWINPVPRRRIERYFLKNHLELWTQAQAGSMPSATAFEVYKRDAEQGIASVRDTQKDLRESFLKAPHGFRIRTPAGQIVTVDVEDPEIYWRVEGPQAWHQAIELKSPREP